MCPVTRREHTIYGYKGKQTRDQINSHDVARLFLEFYAAPRCGEVYYLGGGQTACPFWRRLRSSKAWATKCATCTIPPIASVITFATICDSRKFALIF